MIEPELPRSKLTLWALSVLSRAVDALDHDPLPATPRLRLAMAWLSVASDEKEALDLLWEEARAHMSDRVGDYQKAYMRGTNARLRLEGICERMGTSHWRIRSHVAENPPTWPEE